MTQFTQIDIKFVTVLWTENTPRLILAPVCTREAGWERVATSSDVTSSGHVGTATLSPPVSLSSPHGMGLYRIRHKYYSIAIASHLLWNSNPYCGTPCWVGSPLLRPAHGRPGEAYPAGAPDGRGMAMHQYE